MSRYVCHFSVNLSPQDVRLPLRKLFEACELETIYETDDYLMAREIPGRVIFTKLVTAEVSIDPINTTSEGVTLTFLVKNEELPLKPDNHCRQIFDLLRVAIAHDYDWETISSVRSISALSSPKLEQSLLFTEESPVINTAVTQPISIDPALVKTVSTLDFLQKSGIGD